MRRAVLWSSVARHLDPDEDLLDVAYMWYRRPMSLPFAFVAGVVVGVIAWLSGFSVASASGFGVATLALAGAATTRYRVLAVTSTGLVLMGGSRIRQVAKPPVERLVQSTVVERVGSNLVISEWKVGEGRFSVLRRFESTMAGIAARTQR